MELLMRQWRVFLDVQMMKHVDPRAISFRTIGSVYSSLVLYVIQEYRGLLHQS